MKISNWKRADRNAFRFNLRNHLMPMLAFAVVLGAQNSACAKSPPDWDKLLAKGNQLMGVAKNKEAAQEFAKLLEKYPDSAVCHLQMGRAQKKAGVMDEAKEHFRRACELDSSCADAFYELGCMQESDKQYTEAAASFQHFLSLKPEGAARKNIEDRIRFCQQQK